MCSLEAECKDTVEFKFTNTDTKLQHQNTIYTPTEHLSIQQHTYIQIYRNLGYREDYIEEI